MKQNKYLFDGHKLIWHMDRIHKHYREGEKIYPLHIDIGLTKACNARCAYCYGLFQNMTNEFIPNEQLKQLFHDAPKLGIKSMTMTGDGEPTIHPVFQEALWIGHEGGLDMGLATNGIALDDEKIKTILSTCTWLRFNLSAVDKESYKSIHGIDQWERVQANIKRTVALKKELSSPCTIGLQMVLVPECAQSVVPEAFFAVENEVDYFVIKQFSDPGCEEMSRFNLSWYDNEKIKVTLRTAESLSNDKTKIIPKWGMIASKGKRPYDKCVDCALLFQVSGSGKCYPCGYLFGDDKYCYGDLNKQSLQNILDSNRYWEVVTYMRNKFDVHKDCQGCCRHDFTNEFMWRYLNPPEHINFI